MKLTEKNAIIIIFFLLAFSLSAYASVAYDRPVGADIWFHIEITKVYLAGGNGMFADFVMEINRIPYPPLFHVLLMPSVMLGVENPFSRVLQAFFYPGCVVAALLIVKRFGVGRLHMAVTGLAMLGSWAYLDATFQIRPETLDMLLWLVFAYAILAEKKKLGVGSVIAGVYNHSFPMLVFDGGGMLA